MAEKWKYSVGEGNYLFRQRGLVIEHQKEDGSWAPWDGTLLELDEKSQSVSPAQALAFMK